MSINSFPRRERLSLKVRISQVFKKGRRCSCEGISLFVLPNNAGCNRFLCTFRRGFGNAVERNRVRRVFKEIYRQNKWCLKTNFDIIVLPSNSFLKEKNDFAVQSASFLKILKKLGLA